MARFSIKCRCCIFWVSNSRHQTGGKSCLWYWNLSRTKSLVAHWELPCVSSASYSNGMKVSSVIHFCLCFHVFYCVRYDILFCFLALSFVLDRLLSFRNFITVFKGIMGNRLRHGKKYRFVWKLKQKIETRTLSIRELTNDSKQVKNKPRDHNCFFDFFFNWILPIYSLYFDRTKSQESCEKRKTFGKNQCTQNMALVSKSILCFFALMF